MKYLIIVFVFLMSITTSYCQSKKFEELYNKMFFNIFIHRPDSSVFDFIKKYLPTFTNVQDSAGWTIYPPDKHYNEPQKTEHALLFYKHPFFDIKFTEGRLELLTSEVANLLPRMRQAKLSFSFSNKVEAEKALLDLTKIFVTVSQKKKIIFKNEKKIVLLTDKERINESNCVEFILLKDELREGSYKLLFSWGLYTYNKKYYGLLH